MRKLIFGVMLVTAMVGCGGGGGTPGDDVGDDAPDAPPGTPDADPDGWQVLAQGSWTLPPGSLDEYYCIYATVPRDIYVKAFRPLIPNGTHHTVATFLSDATPADGIYPCNVSTNGQNMFYGSGVGSPDFVFPEGVGIHFRPGDRMLINLHLYNATDGELTGTSGTLFQEATAAEIQHEAEIILAGPTFQLSVPYGMTTRPPHDCTLGNHISAPIHVFSLSQHMHKLGRHMRSEAVHSDDTITLLQDIDYAFESQTFQLVAPTIELQPTDRIRTYCTFDNPNPPPAPPVGFGESSDDEMCFTDLFYYPAQQAELICTL